MLRQYVSITLAVSLVALGSSGMLMIVLNSLAFQFQMHPVHKIFGVVMVVAGCLHVYLNFTPIRTYLKKRKVLVVATALSVLLLLLFAIGFNKSMDTETIEQIEQLMGQMGPKR